MSALGTNAEAAAAYYDHGDVAAFYRRLWGGADIHIGLYDRDDVSVAEASRAMTGHLLDLAGFGRGSRVLDIACGYGGTLVALARRGCVAQGLDISTLCVTTARKTLAAAGLAEQVAVELGDFHALPCSDAAFDGAICQESLIHSNDRPRVFAEVFRVLRPGGTFAFSDILTGAGARRDLVEAAFARLGAEAGATPQTYRDMAERAGFEIRHAEERPGDIAAHYDRLADLLGDNGGGLPPSVAERLTGSIAAWRRAISGGHITWACFVARKPA